MEILHKGSHIDSVSIAEVDILGNHKNKYPADVRIHHKAGTFSVKIFE